jgi:hypothetical protein
MTTGLVNIARTAALVVGMVATGAAQTAPTLSSLTAPEKDLPSGCRLRPIASGTTVPRILFPFPDNPWIGPDRRHVIEIRKSIDGPLRLPDAPPLTRKEQTALEHRWVANVVEGYRADYISSEGVPVQVAAIRYDDPKFVDSTAPGTRLALGAIVALVTGDSKTTCFQAIQKHLRSLK